MADYPHVYTSTACQHQRHEKCRLICKFCEVRCRCICHMSYAPRPGDGHEA